MIFSMVIGDVVIFLLDPLDYSPAGRMFGRGLFSRGRLVSGGLWMEPADYFWGGRLFLSAT